MVLEKNPKYLLTVDQLFIWESFIIDERRLGKFEKVDGKERARICAKVEMIYQFFTFILPRHGSSVSKATFKRSQSGATLLTGVGSNPKRDHLSLRPIIGVRKKCYRI